MIGYQNDRYNGGSEPVPLRREMTTSRAFESLVFGEIGFGTTITELTPTRLVCRTTIFGNTDVVTFNGTAQEMEPLVIAASIFAMIREQHNEQLIQSVLDQLPRTSTGGYKIFNVRHLSGFLMGQSLVKNVCLLTINVEPTAELLRMRSEDILAATTLHLETGEPFDEILAMA